MRGEDAAGRLRPGPAACRFLIAESIDVDKFSGSPSLEHMRSLYGPEVTERELDAALVPFYKYRDGYRMRFREYGIAISYQEAIDA